MGSRKDVPCYSAALYGLVSKTQESVYLQCMRAVHVAQTITGPPNLLHLSHTFVARLCRISRLQMTVSTAKLIKRLLQEPCRNAENATNTFKPEMDKTLQIPAFFNAK